MGVRMVISSAVAACLKNGAGEEDRTLDIHLGKVALYR